MPPGCMRAGTKPPTVHTFGTRTLPVHAKTNALGRNPRLCMQLCDAVAMAEKIGLPKPQVQGSLGLSADFRGLKVACTGGGSVPTPSILHAQAGVSSSSSPHTARTRPLAPPARVYLAAKSPVYAEAAEGASAPSRKHTKDPRFYRSELPAARSPHAGGFGEDCERR